MANIAFKRGLHANLPWSSAIDGCFYLTTDTNRLYVGKGTQLIDLNKYIKIVSSIDELTSLTNKQNGDFAYISGGNILAVYNGTDWVQINKNTNTDRYIDASSIKTSVVKDVDNSKITLTLTMDQKNVDINDGSIKGTENLSMSFDIPKEYLNSLAVETNVDLAASAVIDGANIKTSGVGSSGSGINLKEGSNVTISASGSDITIAAEDTTYSLVSDAERGTVGLKDSGGTTTNVTFKAGEKLSTSVDANRNVTYTHIGSAATANTTATENVTNGGSFTVLKEIATDSTGHVSTYTPVTLTLPELATTDVSSVSAGRDGKITIVSEDSKGSTITKTSGADLFYTVGKDSKVTIYNGNDLGVYTADEIDKMMVGLNAMVYKGTISGSLPTENVKVGYTYMVETAGTYNNISAEVGDLFIANGTENDDGILTFIEWDYVPSGDDIDTQFTLNTNNNKVTLKQSNSTGSEVASVTFEAGNDVVVSTTTAGANSVINIAHEAFTTTESTSAATDKNPGYGGSFKVVDEIVADNGHVTGYKTKTVTLPASDNTTYTYSAASAANGATITLEDNGGSKQDISLVEGTDILVDVSGKNITLAHKAYGNTTASEKNGSITDKKFKAVNAITVENGHVTGFDLAEFTMPTERNYTLSGGATAIEKGVKLTNELTETTLGSKAGSTSLSLVSDSLNIAANTSDTSKYSIELEWGTF